MNTNGNNYYGWALHSLAVVFFLGLINSITLVAQPLIDIDVSSLKQGEVSQVRILNGGIPVRGVYWGIGSERCCASFDNAMVTNAVGHTEFYDSFSSSRIEWNFKDGTWIVDSGKALQTDANSDGGVGICYIPSGYEGSVEVDATKISGNGGLVFVVSYTDKDNFVSWTIGYSGNNGSKVEQTASACLSLLSSSSFSLVNGQTYKLKATFLDDYVNLYIDGVLLHSILLTNTQPVSASVSLSANGKGINATVINPAGYSQSAGIRIINADMDEVTINTKGVTEVLKSDPLTGSFFLTLPPSSSTSCSVRLEKYVVKPCLIEITESFIKNPYFTDAVNHWENKNMGGWADVVQGPKTLQCYVEGNTAIYSFFQTIRLPAGNYRLRSNALFRNGAGNTYIDYSQGFLLAGNKAVRVNTIFEESPDVLPGDDFDASINFRDGYYVNQLDFSLLSDTDIQIGMKGEFTQGWSWFAMSPIHLFCVANTTAIMKVSTKAQWATFVAPFDVEIPEGIKAYSVCFNGSRLVNTELKNGVIDAGTPVLLKNIGTTDFVKEFTGQVTDSRTQYQNDNLIGTTTTILVPKSEGDFSVYLLQYRNSQIGWYKVSAESLQLIANRAYLFVPSASESKDFIPIDDEVTCIDEKQVPTDNSGSLINLAGQQVGSGFNGIVIKNGKKYLVR